MFQHTIRLYQSAYRGLPPSVWLLAGVMFINRCGTMVLPFLTLYLTQYLHFSVAQAGIIMAVYGMGAFVGTFIGGRLTDRFGFYYIQLFSLLFGGFWLILLQFVTNFYALCGCVFTFTLLGDSFRPANQAAIAYYSDIGTRTRAFSLNRLAINLGWAIGGGIGGWLASIQYNLLFWTDGLTCLLAGVVLWLFLPVPHQTTPANLAPSEPATLKTTSPQDSPYRDKLFIAFVLCAALYLAVFMQLFSIVPLFFREILQMKESAIGFIMALNGLIIVVVEMALVYSLEQQNHSKIRLIMIGITFTSLAYLSLAFANLHWFGSQSAALLFILLATVGEMMSMPFIQAFSVERSRPATRGQYIALYSMGTALAQTTAPAFGSQMVASFGFSTHWITASIICMLASGGFWLVGRQLQQAGRPTSR
ncbi:MFS transporter [Spirosoma sp. SC4-14]|uniref:MFS transporter n=1 Tax=Spirosoma sp. SC4-14 TaxID=3128900 RepID=UPI0030D0841F